MRTFCPKAANVSNRRNHGGSQAFTLMDLLVVIGLTALLAVVALSAAFTTQERVYRAECASNLKQISIATLVYAAENNNYVPLRSWRDAPPNSDDWWKSMADL